MTVISGKAFEARAPAPAPDLDLDLDPDLNLNTLSAPLCVLLFNRQFVTFEKVTSHILLPFFHAFLLAKTPQNAICYFVTFSGRVSPSS